MTKVKQKAKPARKRKLEVDKSEEVKKVKPGVSSLVVEQLVSADSEVALSALASLADCQEDKIQDFFAGN